MIWISILALSMLSGLCYRLGGWGDEGRKQYPGLPNWMFNTKVRDFGCPLCGGIGVALLMGWGCCSAIAAFVSFGLLFMALTTYWGFVFGYANHWMHGFMCGLAYFPYAIVSENWVGFGVRCIALTILMGLISALSDNDIVEEVGRGAVIPITLPLLLL